MSDYHMKQNLLQDFVDLQINPIKNVYVMKYCGDQQKSIEPDIPLTTLKNLLRWQIIIKVPGLEELPTPVDDATENVLPKETNPDKKERRRESTKFDDNFYGGSEDEYYLELPPCFNCHAGCIFNIDLQLDQNHPYVMPKLSFTQNGKGKNQNDCEYETEGFCCFEKFNSVDWEKFIKECKIKKDHEQNKKPSLFVREILEHLYQTLSNC